VKILYHHRTRSRDGQRIHIDGLVGALRRAGHEVSVVSPPLQESRPDTAATPGSRAWLRPLRELAEMAYNLVEGRRLRRALRDTPADAVYARHALFCTAPVREARRQGLPVMVEVNAPLAAERMRHGGLCFRGLALRQETRTLNRADRVIVVTEVMKRLLVAQGVEAPRIEVHHNGVDPTRGAPDPARLEELREQWDLGGTTVLGFVGFVRDWNRLDRLFPVLEQDPHRVFLVVGNGPDRPRLEAAARSRGLGKQVRFVGTVPAAEVRSYVALFDVALIPDTPAYASPLKLLDYLDAGCAILAPDRDNLREVLTDGRNARLFDADAEHGLDGLLEELLAQPEQRAALGKAARETIPRLDLTWDHNARRVLARFQALCAGSSTAEARP